MGAPEWGLVAGLHDLSADVHEMSRRLGARSRANAVALISGVDG